MSVSEGILESFHRVLVEEIASKRPRYLAEPFTVAEIYQDLVPYSTHRDRIGIGLNGDYEDALIRMLAGEGGYLTLESEHALRDLRRELETRNPNTGVYREYAAVDVRLNPDRLGDSIPASAEDEGPMEASSTNGAAIHSGGDRSDPGAVPDMDPAAHVEEPAGASTEAGQGEADTDQRSASRTDGACRWCRADLPERQELKYCPYCGTDVRAIPCASCGQELEPEWRFCIACGTEARS